MKSSLKRSAADAFGSSQDLPVRCESHDSGSAVDDNDRDDVQPTTKLISKIQAVELLEKLIQFVPKEYSEGSAVPERNVFATKNPEIADIKLMTQFKLRYLCRRFNNIVLSRISLMLNCFVNKEDEYGLFVSDVMGIRLSHDKTVDQLAELSPRLDVDASKETCGTFAASVVANIRSLKLGVPELGFSCAHDRLYDEPIPSIPALLGRLSDTLSLPCRLFLDLQSISDNTHKYFVKDFDISLQRQCPSVTLQTLEFCTGVIDATADNLLSESRILKYFLEFGQHSLVKLSVSAYTLMPLFSVMNNDRASTLPEDWTCATLQTLSLAISPFDEDYDLNDNNNRAAFVAFCASLPHIFPNVKKIRFCYGNPLFDFSVLRHFARLAVVCFYEARLTDEQWQCFSDLALTNVNSVDMEMENDQSTVAALFPNLRALEHATGSLEDYTTQLSTANGCFPFLRDLIVKLPIADITLSSHYDCILLFRSLHRLSRLTSLRLELNVNAYYHRTWCPEGDLSLISVLPETIANARFVFALRPTAVDFDDITEEWSLSCHPNIPCVEENVYLDWLRALLFRTVEHPSLVRFFCVCAAPRFEILLALAENWSKSSAAAIAKLGLTFVAHVQCSLLYARMAETRIPARGDRLRLRFVLTPRLIPSTAQDTNAEMLSKRKVVTVEFENS